MKKVIANNKSNNAVIFQFNTMNEAANYFGESYNNLRNAHFRKGDKFEYKITIEFTILADKKGEIAKTTEITKTTEIAKIVKPAKTTDPVIEPVKTIISDESISKSNELKDIANVLDDDLEDISENDEYIEKEESDGKGESDDTENDEII